MSAFYRETPLPDGRCPQCNEVNDTSTMLPGSSKAVPRDDDVSLCFYCGGIAIYIDNASRLRAATPMEAMSIESDPRIPVFRAALTLVKRRRGL